MMCWFAFWEAFYRDLYTSVMAQVMARAVPEMGMFDEEALESHLHLVESPHE